MAKISLFLLLLLVCVSCRNDQPPPIWSKIAIEGRTVLAPLYSARMPQGWSVQKPLKPETDTTKALAEFLIPPGPFA